jgi:hypothetical protein
VRGALLKDMHEVKKGMYDLEKDVEGIQRKARVLSLYADNLEERFQEVHQYPSCRGKC